MSRPEFITAGSTVAACDAIASYLRPKLSGDKVAQVQAVERHVGRFNEPSEIKRYMTGSDGATLNSSQAGCRERLSLPPTSWPPTNLATPETPERR
jgi:hypothetical protein